jgi:hypothetical protein
MSKRQQVEDWANRYFTENGEWPSISATSTAIGYDMRETRRVLSKLRAGKSGTSKSEKAVSDTIQKVLDNDNLHLVINSLTISTIEEALLVADVDLGMWAIKGSRVNSWQVHVRDADDQIVAKTNYQVSIDLIPRIKKPVDIALSNMIDRLLKSNTKAKAAPRAIKKSDDSHMLEIALYDAHFGKLAWAKETRQEDYDTKIAESIYVNACEEIISHATSHKIDKIVFPIGQDFFHINNPEGMTPQGKHQLDMDTRMPKIFEAGMMAVFKAVEMCLEVAPTELIWVPGNHDPETSYFLMRVIKAFYEGRGEKFLSVDLSPTHRKAIVYGNSFLAFAHGQSEKINKLPNLMMVEWPEQMARARFKEWHIGHIHKKDEEKYFPVQTVAGVLIRRIPALSAIDAWHYKFGFVDAVRAAEGFLWSKDRGVVNHITSNLIHS